MTHMSTSHTKYCTVVLAVIVLEVMIYVVLMYVKFWTKYIYCHKAKQSVICWCTYIKILVTYLSGDTSKQI